MKKLVIIGAGGHGKVAADIALKMNKWEQIEFLDDIEGLRKSMGIEISGKTDRAVSKINEYDLFVAIGRSEIRVQKQNYLEKSGASIPVLIHPNAVIGTDVKIGKGTVIMAGAVINSCTQIGKGCVINTSSSVDHDCKVGDYTHICPGVNVAGSVVIGNNSWIGIGSTISNNVNICSECFIGAGTVIVKDINSPGTYVGCPARKLK